jgi:hypothetical protein
MAQSDIIYYTQPNIYGRKFKCTKRTAALLDRTKARLKKKAEKDKKNYYLRIIQGCYNTTVEASAGTHDFDACLDVEIVGMDWFEAQRWLRSQGWAAWVRVPPTFSYHIHMIALPPYKTNFVSRVGIYVPGQVTDYYAHRSGLVGSAYDNTWHPDNIKNTIFNYTLYMSIQAARRARDRIAKRLREAQAKLRRLLKRS